MLMRVGMHIYFMLQDLECLPFLRPLGALAYNYSYLGSRFLRDQVRDLGYVKTAGNRDWV